MKILPIFPIRTTYLRVDHHPCRTLINVVRISVPPREILLINPILSPLDWAQLNYSLSENANRYFSFKIDNLSNTRTVNIGTATPKTHFLRFDIFIRYIYTTKLYAATRKKKQPLMIFLTSFRRISFRFPATRIDKEEQIKRERESGESRALSTTNTYNIGHIWPYNFNPLNGVARVTANYIQARVERALRDIKRGHGNPDVLIRRRRPILSA